MVVLPQIIAPMNQRGDSASVTFSQVPGSTYFLGTRMVILFVFNLFAQRTGKPCRYYLGDNRTQDQLSREPIVDGGNGYPVVPFGGSHSISHWVKSRAWTWSWERGPSRVVLLRCCSSTSRGVKVKEARTETLAEARRKT